MRQGEAEEVIHTFQEEQGTSLVAVNAIEEFMEALSGVTEPEEKRRIRENYRRYREMDKQRRQALRDRYRRMTPEQRQRQRDHLRERPPQRPRDHR